jgi:hypothetical protein
MQAEAALRGLGRASTPRAWITLGTNGSNYLDLIVLPVNNMAHWAFFKVRLT